MSDKWVNILPDGRVFIDYGPTTMVITARRGEESLTELVVSAFPLIQKALKEIASSLPVLRQGTDMTSSTALEGLPRVMFDAVLSTGEKTLTPMAAVAGAVADVVAEWIYAQGADVVLVNNGGDVAIRLAPGQQIRMGILPDIDGKISQVVTINSTDNIGGVCTSGLGGRSLTRGIANSVTVFSSNCAVADACATHIANSSYIASPRVHTCDAKEVDPESDIAELSIVYKVDALNSAEIKQGLNQILAVAEHQRKRNNLLYAAADIQGRCVWFPNRLP